MEKTEQLETRIGNALERLRAVGKVNAELNGRLTELQAARKKDLAELDALVEELKPLVEGE